MDQKGENKFEVTREYEWNLRKDEISSAYYFISEIFEISLLNNKTLWQIVFYNDLNSFRVCLHKVKSSNNDFVVSLTMNAALFGDNSNTINRQYAGDSCNGNWFFVPNFDDVFRPHNNCCHLCKPVISLKIKISMNLKMEASYHQSNYENFLNSDELSDFKFICSDGKEINAHRLILMAHSPVMAKMLTTPMIESKNSEVKLDDIDSETMLEVLRFMYTGKLNIFENFASELLYCAKKYELHEFKKFVVQLMIKNLSVENVLEYFALAEQYDEEDLFGCCVLEIKRNYRTICQHEDWAKFDRKMKALFKLLLKDILDIKTLNGHYSLGLPKEYNKLE